MLRASFVWSVVQIAILGLARNRVGLAVEVGVGSHGIEVGVVDGGGRC